MPRTKLRDRKMPAYTRGEEIFNMVSHIVGGGVGAAALVLCVVFAAVRGNVWGIVSGTLFGASMILLYTTSALYHALRPGSMAKRVFQVLDHCTIFVLIAGTYTPFALVSLRSYEPWIGWVVFGVIWAMAALGIALNAVDLKRYKIFSMICYLVMGWCIIFAWKPLVASVPTAAVVLLLAGGISYTLGAILYGVGSKRPYFHSIFHLFVVLASIAHTLSILLYVM